jgi:hypothetical protein
VGWFTKKPPIDKELLRKAASLVASVQGESSVYAVRVLTRARLIAEGYDAEMVERVLELLLRY